MFLFALFRWLLVFPPFYLVLPTRVLILIFSFPLLFAFVVGGLGFQFCVFVSGWRHALRSEWPFIIIIITAASHCIHLAVVAEASPT